MAALALVMLVWPMAAISWWPVMALVMSMAVLGWFDDDMRQWILGVLHDRLADDGVLVVGEGEPIDGAGHLFAPADASAPTVLARRPRPGSRP